MQRKLTSKNPFRLLEQMLQIWIIVLLLFTAFRLSSQNPNTNLQDSPLVLEAQYRPLSKTVIPYVSANLNTAENYKVIVSIGEYIIIGLGPDPSNQELKESVSQYMSSPSNSQLDLLAQEIEKQDLGVIYSDSKIIERAEGSVSFPTSFRPFSGSPGKVYYLQAETIHSYGNDIENSKSQILFYIPNKSKISYPEFLKFSARGTGRTTGHIINLTVRNTGKQRVDTEIGPSIVPCGKKNKDIAVQGFFTYETYPISLAPGESIQIPIKGYCINNDKPPPGAGDTVVRFEEWITPQDVGFIPDPTIPFPQNTSFQVNKNYTSQEIQLVYPGTDTPFPYQIDIKKHLNEAAPIIFFTGESLLQTIEQEIQNGTLITPISRDSLKLTQTAVQHDMWLVTSALDSDEKNKYGFEEFRDNTLKQIEKTTGQDKSSLPQETQEGIDIGIVDLFSGFTLVGEKAKVLKKNQPLDTGFNGPVIYSVSHLTGLVEYKAPGMGWSDLTPETILNPGATIATDCNAELILSNTEGKFFAIPPGDLYEIGSTSFLENETIELIKDEEEEEKKEAQIYLHEKSLIISGTEKTEDISVTESKTDDGKHKFTVTFTDKDGKSVVKEITVDPGQVNKIRVWGEGGNDTFEIKEQTGDLAYEFHNNDRSKYYDKVSSDNLYDPTVQADEAHKGIAQGFSCHCDFLASLAGAVMRKGIDFIKEKIKVLDKNKYEVTLYNSHTKNYEKVIVEFDGNVHQGDAQPVQDDEKGWVNFWPLVLQRAMMKMYDLPYTCGGKPKPIEGKGIWTISNALKSLTGNDSERNEIENPKNKNSPMQCQDCNQITSKEDCMKKLDELLKDGNIIVAGTNNCGTECDCPHEEHVDKIGGEHGELYPNHCYTVKSIDKNAKTVTLYNPHGHELTVTFDQFYNSFASMISCPSK